MSNYLTDGYHRDEPAAYAPVNERVAFIQRTYLHLAIAIAALVGLEALLLQSGAAMEVMKVMWGSPISLLLVLGLFIGGGFLARSMARANSHVAVKYLGLALYVAIWAIMLLPILYIAIARFGMGIVNQAAVLTLVTFGGLTLAVLVSKKDFSFLGYGLMLASFGLLGLVIVAIVMPLLGGPTVNLGMWFSFLVIALAAGYILYDTSNILHHYNTNEHVAASLELFGDVALLFYHILRVLMLSRND